MGGGAAGRLKSGSPDLSVSGLATVTSTIPRVNQLLPGDRERKMNTRGAFSFHTVRRIHGLDLDRIKGSGPRLIYLKGHLKE